MGFDKLPICMAKTQYSFSHDATKKGESEKEEADEERTRFAITRTVIVSVWLKR